MPEAYSFREGTLHLWTGAATASGASVGYAQNVNIDLGLDFQADPALSGNYRTHLAGRQGTYSVEMLWTYSSAVRQIFFAETAGGVHFKITEAGVNGSAGIILYSGSMNRLTYQGSEGALMRMSLGGFGHVWSAF